MNETVEQIIKQEENIGKRVLFKKNIDSLGISRHTPQFCLPPNPRIASPLLCSGPPKENLKKIKESR